jgi:hypothetical protein
MERIIHVSGTAHRQLDGGTRIFISDRRGGPLGTLSSASAPRRPSVMVSVGAHAEAKRPTDDTQRTTLPRGDHHARCLEVVAGCVFVGTLVI